MDAYDGFSDNEEDALLTSPQSRESTQLKRWDVFNLLPNEEIDETDSSNLLDFAKKLFKFLSYVVTFIVVLATSVFSKVVLFVMTSLAQPKQRLSICRADHQQEREYEVVIDDDETRSWIWCLYFIIIIPDLFCFVRSARICIFKSFTKPKCITFVVEFISQTLHTIGLTLLIFGVFPYLYAFQAGILSCCVATVPSLLQLFSHKSDESKIPFKVVLDVLCIIAQLGGPLTILLLSNLKEQTGLNNWLIPLSLILTSFCWWENFINSKSSLKCIQMLAEIKKDLNEGRYLVWMFISLWKIILTLVVMLLFTYSQGALDVNELFTHFKNGFEGIQNNVTRTKYTGDSPDVISNNINNNDIKDIGITVSSNGLLPVYLALCHVVACWLCYVWAKFACRTSIQGFAFSLPLQLATPVTLCWIIISCNERIKNICYLRQFSEYVFWNCPNHSILQYLNDPFGWFSLIWIFSQIWITLHTWTPKSERLASTESLFVNPMYCSPILDQSILLNRRKYVENAKKENNEEDNVDSSEIGHFYDEASYVNRPSIYRPLSAQINDDTTTRIYACATMWHETKEEMIQLLKSLFRMDEDQCARRNALKFLSGVDCDFYLFEAHIFFDDAFEESQDSDFMVVNQFVRLLIRVIDIAASNVHDCMIRLKPPKKIPTPYGGQLVWTMPGKNKIIVHLKDKSKIRHKKRWSQVMYMYYLLGNGIMEINIESSRKDIRAENTYLLALDGDINFRPEAVQLLVDLMKKNRMLGAACGRIHPVGSGPMVWYQKFEYAIGHWLQKATEHMIGCVLCSPGCFSLFRAKALMDDNVMRKYTTVSEQARHYVQYDQGEDRWLCTLLLQRGYRVEYCAASDAYTQCPEGFGEFYNQRRRWAPSTLANIMDLLGDYKRTVEVNDNISTPYIAYQLMLMIGSILGPSTIFLMLVGAMVASFRISNYEALIANLVPIILYILICFFAKNDFQILFAQILSALYALLMMAVLVATAIQLVEDGIGSPAAIFLIALSSSFIISGILHPQEFTCLLHGFLYFLSVPSMYLFLILYSLINLNNVSWGTREVVSKKTKKDLEEEKKQVEEIKKTGMLSDWLNNFGLGGKNENEDGDVTCSLSNLFTCMLCTRPKDGEHKYQLLRITDKIDVVDKKLGSLETRFETPKNPNPYRRKSSVGRVKLPSLQEVENESEEEENEVHFEDESSISEEATYAEDTKRDDLVNPYWIEDKVLKRAEVDCLNDPEIEFWTDLINRYLLPIEQNKEHQAKVSDELKELRNRVVFAYFMLNSLFILVVFLLQLNKKQLHFNWPIGVKYDITYVILSKQIKIESEYLEIDPIGIVFVSFFALILVVQFLGMLFHRLSTITHILASEKLSCCTKKMEGVDEDEQFVAENAIQIAREMQKLKGVNGDEDIKEEEVKGDLKKRNTIINLEKRQTAKQKIATLDVAFITRFKSISSEGVDGTPILKNLRRLSVRRGTLKVLEERSKSIMAEIQRADSLRPNSSSSETDWIAMQRLEQFSLPNGLIGITNPSFEADGAV